MEQFSPELVVFAYLGIIFLQTIVTIFLAAALIYGALQIFNIAIVIIGKIGDYFYTPKMLRGEVPYRLPSHFRLGGWQVADGNDPDTYRYKTSVFFDNRVNAFIPIKRLTDRAFLERYRRGFLVFCSGRISSRAPIYRCAAFHN